MNRIEFPTFYAIPIFLVIALKAIIDAFFEVGLVKYIYFLFIFFAVCFHYAGTKLGNIEQLSLRSERTIGTVNLWLYISMYFSFLILLSINRNGSLELIAKIISPFIFFGLLYKSADRCMPLALALGAALNILVNAALLPFDFGWTYWGGIRTFKGFYYFKTDLAYSLATSVVIYSAWRKFRITPDVILMLTLALAMAALSNSRLNYATLGIVLVFVAYKNSAKPLALTSYILVLLAIVGIGGYFYDPGNYLGFNVSDTGHLTQGRDRIFGVLWSRISEKYSPSELLFGGGLYADLVIYMEEISEGAPNGAHNDFLYIITTQGIFGLLLSTIGWYLIHSMTYVKYQAPSTRGVVAIGLLIYLLQGLTLATSISASKTWPLVLFFIARYTMNFDSVSTRDDKTASTQ